MSTTRLLLDFTTQDLPALSAKSYPRKPTLNDLENYIAGVASGAKRASNLNIRDSAVAASGAVTAASVLAADTVTVAGQVFTAVNGGSPTSVQFDMSGTDSATATNLAAAISNHATVGKYVSAAAVGGVVTITCKTPGAIGNAITLASSNNTRLAVSGAALASGSDGTLRSVTL